MKKLLIHLMVPAYEVCRYNQSLLNERYRFLLKVMKRIQFGGGAGGFLCNIDFALNKLN